MVPESRGRMARGNEDDRIGQESVNLQHLACEGAIRCERRGDGEHTKKAQDDTPSPGEGHSRNRKCDQQEIEQQVCHRCEAP